MTKGHAQKKIGPANPIANAKTVNVPVETEM